MPEQKDGNIGAESMHKNNAGAKETKEMFGVEGDLTEAIAIFDEAAPLVFTDGFVVTDGGHVIASQYVDIGIEKLTHRPSVLVKAIESQYGIEHAADVQLSTPWRFRDYGETLIRDDQEGYAHHETRTETRPRSPEESHREQERALGLLGVDKVTVSGTGLKSSDTNTASITFGKNDWIYCTSLRPEEKRHDVWRSSLPDSYDHESTIRQPRKFALALGEMFADQRGPQGKRDDHCEATSKVTLKRHQN